MALQREYSLRTTWLVLLCLSFSIGEAQVRTHVPKLVVNVVVDQLRGDYLSMLLAGMGDDGIKRMLSQGMVFDEVEYDYADASPEANLTTLLSGCNPFYHGVSGRYLYNRSKGRIEPVFEDFRFPASSGYRSVSPAAIRTTTVVDELKVATDGLGEAFSFAPSMELAVIGGGHAADAAFWIDSQTGDWTTSSYYQFIPSYFWTFQKGERLSKRIDKMEWTSVFPANFYEFLPYAGSDVSFKYHFSSFPVKTRYPLYKRSALVNEEVTALVKHFLETGALGKHRYPDFLNVVYTAEEFQADHLVAAGYEIQDTYLRLDRSISDLIWTIDKSVGLENALILFSSTGYRNHSEAISPKLNIPSGNFYPRRAAALLNFFLVARYGEGQWMDGYLENQIFLNRKLIDDRKLSLQEVQMRSAEFLTDMSGVQKIFCSYAFIHDLGKNEVLSIAKGFHPKQMGDLYLEIEPGWRIQNDEEKEHYVYQRRAMVAAPIVFFGLNIKPERINRSIKATEVAPSVSYYLRIRSPNGAQNRPIRELVNP